MAVTKLKQCCIRSEQNTRVTQSLQNQNNTKSCHCCSLNVSWTKLRVAHDATAGRGNYRRKLVRTGQARVCRTRAGHTAPMCNSWRDTHLYGEGGLRFWGTASVLGVMVPPPRRQTHGARAEAPDRLWTQIFIWGNVWRHCQWNGKTT